MALYIDRDGFENDKQLKTFTEQGRQHHLAVGDKVSVLMTALRRDLAQAYPSTGLFGMDGRFAARRVARHGFYVAELEMRAAGAWKALWLEYEMRYLHVQKTGSGFKVGTV